MRSDRRPDDKKKRSRDCRGFSAPAWLFGQPLPCIPPAQQAAQALANRQIGGTGARPGRRADLAQPARHRDSGVVAEGAKWRIVWQAAGNSADGIIPDKDGSVLVAQEDYGTVLKIGANGNGSVAVGNAKGIGSLSMDRQGRLYGGHRTERPGSTKPDRDSIVNAISLLAPDRKTIADKWVDGGSLTVDLRKNSFNAFSVNAEITLLFVSSCILGHA